MTSLCFKMMALDWGMVSFCIPCMGTNSLVHIHDHGARPYLRLNSSPTRPAGKNHNPVPPGLALAAGCQSTPSSITGMRRTAELVGLAVLLLIDGTVAIDNGLVSELRLLPSRLRTPIASPACCSAAGTARHHPRGPAAAFPGSAWCQPGTGHPSPTRAPSSPS